MSNNPIYNNDHKIIGQVNKKILLPLEKQLLRYPFEKTHALKWMPRKYSTNSFLNTIFININSIRQQIANSLNSVHDGVRWVRIRYP